MAFIVCHHECVQETADLMGFGNARFAPEGKMLAVVREKIVIGFTDTAPRTG